jgi:hypothetical protein
MYNMADVPLIPKYKLVLEKVKFGGNRAYYNICTDPDLGIGWAAIRWVVCGCVACKAQLKTAWTLRVDNSAQPSYARDKGCKLWPNYEGENDWRICQLVPRSPEDEREARGSVLCIRNAIEACILMMIREGEVGAVGMTDKVAMGYYVVRWLSKPYSLQVDTDGMAGVIGTGTMVVDAIYFNRVARAPFWYTESGEMTVVEMRHVLKSGLEMEEVSATNPLP